MPMPSQPRSNPAILPITPPRRPWPRKRTWTGVWRLSPSLLPSTARRNSPVSPRAPRSAASLQSKAVACVSAAMCACDGERRWRIMMSRKAATCGSGRPRPRTQILIIMPRRSTRDIQQALMGVNTVHPVSVVSVAGPLTAWICTEAQCPISLSMDRLIIRHTPRRPPSVPFRLRRTPPSYRSVQHRPRITLLRRTLPLRVRAA